VSIQHTQIYTSSHKQKTPLMWGLMVNGWCYKPSSSFALAWYSSSVIKPSSLSLAYLRISVAESVLASVGYLPATIPTSQMYSWAEGRSADFSYRRCFNISTSTCLTWGWGCSFGLLSLFFCSYGWFFGFLSLFFSFRGLLAFHYSLNNRQ